MDLSIIIPTYNERDNLEKLIHQIMVVFKKENIKGEVLIIDDNSPDGTGDLAEILSKKFKNVRVFHRKGKLGLGSAYRFGFEKAKSPIIMEMDGDLSHNPKYIPKFLEAISTYDFAIGSRYIEGGGVLNWSIYRRLVSFIANLIASLILRAKTKDITTGYRAYRKSALSRIDINNIKSNGYSFQVEILTKLKHNGCKLKEIPIIFVDRKYGKSKLSKNEIIKFVYTIFKLRLKH